VLFSVLSKHYALLVFIVILKKSIFLKLEAIHPLDEYSL